MIKIKMLEIDHIKEAQALALRNYNTERGYVPAMPNITAVPDLEWSVKNTKGACAFENGKMVGYLFGWGPRDNVFGCNPHVKGIWSPAHGNAAFGENKIRAYREMYQAVADSWVADGALSHAATLYAHDIAAQKALITYGFGVRCMDAVKFIETREVRYPDGISFSELPRDEAGRITGLNNGLIRHLGKSPCFLNYPERTPDAVQSEADEDDIRYFVAEMRGEIIGYLKLSDDGEHFACGAEDMRNICGAYLLPEHRGKGIYDALLFFTENILAREGFKRLGVDFESFNPTAHGFWRKHFTAYTHSVVRRIDEQAGRAS